MFWLVSQKNKHLSQSILQASHAQVQLFLLREGQLAISELSALSESAQSHEWTLRLSLHIEIQNISTRKFYKEHLEFHFETQHIHEIAEKIPK
jgi:predicted acetyltransferase